MTSINIKESAFVNELRLGVQARDDLNNQIRERGGKVDTEQTTLQYELGFVMSESDLTVYLVLTLIGDPPVAIVFTTNRRVTAEISDMSGKVVWTETMLEKGPGEDLLKDGESLPYGVSVTPLPKDLKPGIYVVECTLHDAVLKPVVRTVVRIKDNSTIKLSSKNH